MQEEKEKKEDYLERFDRPGIYASSITPEQLTFLGTKMFSKIVKRVTQQISTDFDFLLSQLSRH
jgi:hypothetical protein